MPFSRKAIARPRFPLALLLFIPPIVLLTMHYSELPLEPLQVKHSYQRKDKPMPQCASNTRAKSFLIMFMGNSGSTALSTELLGHPETHMNKLEYIVQYSGNSSAALAATRAFFQEGIQKGLTPGFKMRPGHVFAAPEQWQKLVDEFNTRIIWNYRKNVIKSTLTEYVKTVLNDSQNVGGLQSNMTVDERCNVGKGCRYKVDVEKFHTMLNLGMTCNNEITAGVSALDHGRGCVWEVPYEDYLYHREATMADVQRFLGLEPRATQPTRFKGTKDNLCEVIDNYDEVCNRLYGCLVWQPMLEDQLNDCYCRNYVTGIHDAKLCDVKRT